MIPTVCGPVCLAHRRVSINICRRRGRRGQGERGEILFILPMYKYERSKMIHYFFLDSLSEDKASRKKKNGP